MNCFLQSGTRISMWQPYRVCLQDELPLRAALVCLQRPQWLQRQQWWTGLWWVLVQFCSGSNLKMLFFLNAHFMPSFKALLPDVSFFTSKVRFFRDFKIDSKQEISWRSEWRAISQRLSLLWNITRCDSGRCWCWWRASHHLPSPTFYLSQGARQIYELSTGLSPLVRAHMCVLVLCPCVGAGFTQGSLYLLRSKHTRRGPPVSYQRPSLH